MAKNLLMRALAAALVILGAAIAGDAGTVTFNFSSLPDNNNSAQIAAYMNAALTAAGCKNCSVTVTGAVVDQTYTADGHVTGPGNPKISRSYTLGDPGKDSVHTTNYTLGSNTNSALNSSPTSFIANTTESGGHVSDEIYFTFKGLTISSVGFDYEIFPDISCPSMNNCGGSGNPNLPDLTFEAGKNSNGTDALVGAFGTGGTQYAVTPGSGNGNAQYSPASGWGKEYAPQYINSWSGNLSNNNANATELDFVNWPATIGVNNVQLTYQTTPEPSVIELCAVLLGGVLFFSRRLVALAEGVSDSV